jgi:hypothetical protein
MKIWKLRMNPRWISVGHNRDERVCDSVRRLCIGGLIVGRKYRMTMSLMWPFRVDVSPFSVFDRGHCGELESEEWRRDRASKRG